MHALVFLPKIISNLFDLDWESFEMLTLFSVFYLRKKIIDLTDFFNLNDST